MRRRGALSGGMRLEVNFQFEAAHYLPKVPEGHKCGRVHGHSYLVTVAVEGLVDPETGWVVDFGDLRDALAPIVAGLDHQCLNDVPGLDNPTAENLATWLWQQFTWALGVLPVHLQDITVSESGRSRVVYPE